VAKQNSQKNAVCSQIICPFLNQSYSALNIKEFSIENYLPTKRILFLNANSKLPTSIHLNKLFQPLPVIKVVVSVLTIESGAL
jgi:hypothetical protein